ncbi:hypothetical protein [uncultured Oscillibacter sp.]|uniref:hypothetical protein n=1 Tax=uncultured Oscillibacter sp. TaxID=876091 RepID=UPI0025E8C403|nr:hypothetical protein [uncultured Oscillibacter sp.]
MNYVERKGVEEILLPGRFMQKVVGDTGDGYRIPSDIMHVGYCRYCGEAGPMEPHMHAEETVQILRADRAWVRYGSSPDHLDHRLALEKDMTLQFAKREWHVFEYEEGGSLEILFIYGSRIKL